MAKIVRVIKNIELHGVSLLLLQYHCNNVDIFTVVMFLFRFLICYITLKFQTHHLLLTV